jgi:hypothetical protein
MSPQTCCSTAEFDENVGQADFAIALTELSATIVAATMLFGNILCKNHAFKTFYEGGPSLDLL